MTKEEMIYYNFRLPKKLLEQFRKKQEWITVPAKLRRLMERFNKNEIELEDD